MGKIRDPPAFPLEQPVSESHLGNDHFDFYMYMYSGTRYTPFFSSNLRKVVVYFNYCLQFNQYVNLMYIPFCIKHTGTCFIQKIYAPSSSLLQGKHLPFSPSPLRLNIFRLFVIRSLTQLYRYTPEIFLFSSATFKCENLSH